MNKNLLQIDISQSDSETDDDSIKITFRDEDVVQVSFSKLVNQSRYIRDKYLYSEALNSIQDEIKKIKEEFNIDEDIIRFFIQLIQDEKVKIPIEHYKDFYTLSEYFCTPKITSKLNKINQEELFKDLNFTIQILLNSEKANKNLETKLASKIENFLVERVDQCIQNDKFKELPVSTISRILEKSKESFNHNLLLDFIFETAKTHFILFKFIKLHKLAEEKVEELIKFIEEQEEDSKKMYLEYMTFDLSFIKIMKDKYNKLFNDFERIKIDHEQTKKELEQAKIENEQTKEKLNQCTKNFEQAKDEINQTKQELKQAKIENEQTKEKLNQCTKNFEQAKDEINQTENELKQAKIENEQTKEKLNQCIKDFEQAKDEINHMKSEKKQTMQTVIVAGSNRCNQLGRESNNTNGNKIISTPILLSFDPSLLSYSVYCNHSVLVTSNHLLKGIGDNKTCDISSSLQKAQIDHFADFSIKDSSGRQLNPVSAVCYPYGTLYMLSKIGGSGKQLVLFDEDINDGNPIFLDIGNQDPVALFGGYFHAAAICSEGKIIFINRYAVKNSPNSSITAVSLPDGEKASSVAFRNNSVFVLSRNGRVYKSDVGFSSSILGFSVVKELISKEIIFISGTWEHCFAVSKEGHVFGYGKNAHGQLGLGKGTGSVSSFTEISSLEGYKIRAAYAGYMHSLFETQEGKILSCGRNQSGQLLLSNGPSDDVYSPTETTITSGATFCVVGDDISSVFVGCDPPPNAPNLQIE